MFFVGNSCDANKFSNFIYVSYTFLADLLLVGSEVRHVVNQRVVQSFLSYHCCLIHLCYHHYYAAKTVCFHTLRSDPDYGLQLMIGPEELLSL